MNLLVYLNPTRTLFVAITASVFLAACGGDQFAVAPGGGGTGGVVEDKPVVAVGPVTSVSPLLVNNLGFTLSATTRVEIRDSKSSQLRPGMMVRVEAASRLASGDRNVVSISAAPEFIGAVDAVSASTQSFTLLGSTIEWDANTILDPTLRAASDLVAGEAVQVYGYPSGNNRLRATLIERHASTTQQRISGVVQAQGCNTCAASAGDFFVGSLRIRPSGSFAAVSSFLPQPGDLVQITGQFQRDPDRFEADAIQPYALSAAASEGSSMTVQGLLSTRSADTSLLISGLSLEFGDQIKADQTRFGILIVPGNLLKAQGTVRSKRLNAESVELK